MNDAELLRYNRQIMLPEIDIAGQEKLLASSVAVVGLGGLGAPAALYLISTGVGHLVLIDDDVVEETNLQRQIVHSEASLTQTKVSSAARTLSAINSRAEITQYNRRFTESQFVDLFQCVDAVVDATDNAETRYMLNTACLQTGTPLISGAAVRMEGQVSVFDPRDPDSPCYGCLYKDIEDEELNCAENGVASPVVGIIGSIQAMETVKLLVDFGKPLTGNVLYLDAKRMDLKKLRLTRDPNCEFCRDVHQPGTH